MRKVVLTFVFLFALANTYANNFSGNDVKNSAIENNSFDVIILDKFNHESLSFDLSGSTATDEVENRLTSIQTFNGDNIEVEMFDYYVRWCITRNGIKYCTEWVLVIELEEVVIVNPNAN
jgi:hypothetical protein